MPDLAIDSTHAWFARSAPGLVHLDHHAVRPLEQGRHVEADLVELGSTLGSLRNLDAPGLNALLTSEPARGLLVRIIEQLGFKRVVQIMDWLAETPEGRRSIAVLLSSANGGGSIRDALFELNRHTAIGRIFAADRLETLLSACEQTFGGQR